MKLALKAADELEWMLKSGYEQGREGPPRVHRLIGKIKALAEQPAQQQPAPANLWLYWKVDDKSVVTGPFKTHSKDEAYGLDCIDQTPLTVAAPQPAQQEPVAYAVYHRMGGSKSLHWLEQHSPDGDASQYQLLPLYTSSQAERPWVGLTKHEFNECVDGLEDLEDCWTAIEAKLREKNT